ncbi:hypothetical protein JXM83_06015 [Candidatus Woesearchaeota archaeon]|nr:hypothetical protein [Candidatus Woesearchaeota archaeon]
MNVKMMQNKKSQLGFKGLEFILNVIAVIIIIVVVRALISNATQISAFTNNQDNLISLNYVLFSEEGLMPDHYTLLLSSIDEKLKSIQVDDLGIKFELTSDTFSEFYFNQYYYSNTEPLSRFKQYVSGTVVKPVLIIDNDKVKVGKLKITYVFPNSDYRG